MKNSRLFGAVVLLLVLGLMASLSGAQETMRVAIPLFPTAAFPVLVANDRGFFQKEGLTVEPIRINSAPTTYQALISGDVHAVAGAPTGLLPSHAQGADVIALGSWDNLVPYIWVTRDKISDVRELRGKKVGVNRAGSKPWLIIHVLLQDARLDPAKDLTLLQMGGDSQERVAALMRGGIDATLADALFEPIMKKRGFSILRTKTQLLNTNDPEVTDFAYQYLHANSEASLYPPEAAVQNLIRMSGYMDKKLASISAKRILDLSLLEEIGTKRHQRAQK